MSNPRFANGHRRRELTQRLLAAGAHCEWPECPWPDDWLCTAMRERLHSDDARYPVVDEIVPVADGGSPIERGNTRLLHRWCNGRRGRGREPRTPGPRPPVIASPGWGPNQGG